MFTIDGVQVLTDLPDLTLDEAARYVDYVRANALLGSDATLDAVYVKACSDGCIDVTYSARGIPFHRLRRITGYRATRLHMKSMHAA